MDSPKWSTLTFIPGVFAKTERIPTANGQLLLPAAARVMDWMLIAMTNTFGQNN
ncbi:hypothetical protein MASR2M44_13030 [Bacteroidota bacterium]